MTKQEAIDVLQNTIVRFGRSSGKTIYAEAISMAIEALKTRTDGDTISRRDAISAIKKDIMGGLNYESILEELPSAQPERKKGEWIRVTQGAIPEKYMCPFCHRTVEYEGIEHFVSIIYPFCHCGADMRGEEDAKRVIS